MAWTLSVIAFLSLVIAVSPYFSGETNILSAFANAILLVAQIFVFYFLSRMVSVDARIHMTAKLAWYFYEKIILPLAIYYALYKFIRFSPLTALSLCLGILILLDPVDSIGSAIREKWKSNPNNLPIGIRTKNGLSFYSYLPALAAIGLAYWLVLK